MMIFFTREFIVVTDQVPYIMNFKSNSFHYIVRDSMEFKSRFFSLVRTTFDEDLDELRRLSYRKDKKNSRDQIFVKRSYHCFFF